MKEKYAKFYELWNAYQFPSICDFSIADFYGIEGIDEDDVKGLELHERLKDKLLQMLGERDITQADLARKSGITPKTISKIINERIHPGKWLMFSIVIAFECDIEEAKELLSLADYTFNPSKKEDVIVQLALMSKYSYNVMDVNELLYDNGSELQLGSYEQEKFRYRGDIKATKEVAYTKADIEAATHSAASEATIKYMLAYVTFMNRLRISNDIIEYGIREIFYS